MSRSAALNITRNTLALTVARVSVPIFSFLFVVYVARLLGAGVFGQFVLIQTYFQLLQALCYAGIGIVLTRELARQPQRANELTSAAWALVSMLSLCGGVTLLLVPVALGYDVETRMAMGLAALALLPAALSDITESMFVGFEHAEYVTYGTIAENLLRTGLSLLALSLGYGLVVLYAILLLTRILLFAFYLMVLNWRVQRLRWHFELATARQIIRETTFFAFETWLYNIFYRLDVMFLSFFNGNVVVGLYAAAYKLLSPGSVFISSFTSALFPYLSRLHKTNEVTFHVISNTIVKYLLALVLPISLLGCLLSEQIIALFYRSEFAAAAHILQLLSWFLVPSFMNMFLGHLLFARDQQKRSFQIGVLSLLCYVGLSFWLVPLYSGKGAAIALLAAVLLTTSLYVYTIVRAQRSLHLLAALSRVVLANGVLAVVLMLLPQHVVVLLVAMALCYPLLLLLFRVPSATEVEFARYIVREGLQRFRLRQGWRSST